MVHRRIGRFARRVGKRFLSAIRPKGKVPLRTALRTAATVGSFLIPGGRIARGGVRLARAAARTRAGRRVIGAVTGSRLATTLRTSLKTGALRRGGRLRRFAPAVAGAGAGLAAGALFAGTRSAGTTFTGAGLPAIDPNTGLNVLDTGGTMPSKLSTLLGVGAGILGGGLLFGAEQLAERAGVRGGAGFIGRRPTPQQLAIAGVRPQRRRKEGLINRRSLKILKKAQRMEKQLMKFARKHKLIHHHHVKKDKGLTHADLLQILK